MSETLTMGVPVGAAVQLQWLTPIVPRLAERYAVPVSTIWQMAETIYAQFVDARVQAFVKVLVERQLREALRAASPRPAANSTT